MNTITNVFFCKLENSLTRELIYKHELGYYTKNGRLLSLKETHDIICWEAHGEDKIYDPVKDVELTKCLYNYLNSRILHKLREKKIQ